METLRLIVVGAGCPKDIISVVKNLNQVFGFPNLLVGSVRARLTAASGL
jgi:hypothetical protein